MELVFTKGAEKYDKLEVARATGIESIACPKQRIIPHDMVHYAVELVLQKRGFVTRVRDGEPASFNMAPSAESDAVERLVEVFQGDAWSGGRTPACEMIELYAVTCTVRKCMPLRVSESEVDAVRKEMQRLTVLWEAVPVGQSLSLSL